MATTITDGFSEGDDEKVISILKKWKGGPLSDQLFTQLAGMMPQAGVVTIIFRENEGNTEVLFVPRPEGDILWSGMLNLPGKMLRAIDYKREDKTPINGAIERIEKDEIKTKFIEKPIFAGISIASDSRGPLVVMVYIGKVDFGESLPDGFFWCGVDKIKDYPNIIQTEINHIKVALEKYRK